MTATDIALKVLAHLDRTQLATVFWALEKQLYPREPTTHLRHIFPHETHRRRIHQVGRLGQQAAGPRPEASTEASPEGYAAD